ncbi:hypothetical protein Tco_0596679 [Tanacetum coccineum]
MVLEKKVNIKPVNYAVLNQLSEDFGKRFVPQQELSAEQAFWFQMSNPSTDSSDASPVKVDVPSELPKVSLVNASLKKLKFYLAQFDSVVKKRITPDALTEGEWGFEHTKAVFINEIIPFLKYLKEFFNVFDKDLLNEITEVQIVFNQMETVVQQYSVDKRCLEIADKQVLNENERLLEQIISQDIVNIVVNSSENMNASVNVNSSTAMNDSVNYVEMCHKCLKLEAELIKQHNMVEKDEYNKLSKSYSQLDASVKKDIDEIETINIELEHRVSKLIAENEHLKRTYKQLYDLIKPTRVRAKEHSKALIDQLNKKKLKGKDTVDNAAQVSNATTIAPGMYKLNPVILAHRDKNNRETHKYYLKHTIEQAAILREIVEQARSLNPLDSASNTACKYVKSIQELLGYVRDMRPDVQKPSEKLVAVTPMNKVKKVSLLHNIWKPTGKIFTEVGLKWKPTGRTFTLVSNSFPLTRITSTKIVPRKETTPHSVETPKPELKVYSWRPKQVKNVGSSKKAKIVESKVANNSEPNHSWGSNATDVPSSSSIVNDRLSRLLSGI